MPPRSRAPRERLSTLLVVVVAAACWIAANVLPESPGNGWFWQYGWPLIYGERALLRQQAEVYETRSPWLWEDEMQWLSHRRLAVNAACAALAVCGAGAGWERFCTRHRVRRTASLGGLLLGVGWLGTVLALWGLGAEFFGPFSGFPVEVTAVRLGALLTFGLALYGLPWLLRPVWTCAVRLAGAGVREAFKEPGASDPQSAAARRGPGGLPCRRMALLGVMAAALTCSILSNVRAQPRWISDKDGLMHGWPFPFAERGAYARSSLPEDVERLAGFRFTGPWLWGGGLVWLSWPPLLANAAYALLVSCGAGAGWERFCLRHWVRRTVSLEGFQLAMGLSGLGLVLWAVRFTGDQHEGAPAWFAICLMGNFLALGLCWYGAPSIFAALGRGLRRLGASRLGAATPGP